MELLRYAKSRNIRTLRMRDLPSKVGYQPSTIYGLIAQGKFPKPFKLTGMSLDGSRLILITGLLML